MKDYCTNSSCPKCGFIGADTKFGILCSDTFDPHTGRYIRQEVLFRHCTNCGYERKEKPLDRKDAEGTN